MKFLFACWLFLCPTTLAQTNAAETVKESHGTVNIFFANQNGLVAVVDSMLTWKNAQGIDEHAPNATKLFRVDDNTICAMAGFYSFPGALNMNEFAAKFPVIMSHYVRREQSETKTRPLRFSAKLEFLKDVFKFELRNSLEAYIDFNPAFRVAGLQPIVLTLAGYDLDGTLKIAGFTLTPTRTAGGVSFEVSAVPVEKDGPACETAGEVDQNDFLTDGLPPPRVIGKALSCVAAAPTG